MNEVPTWCESTRIIVNIVESRFCQISSGLDDAAALTSGLFSHQLTVQPPIKSNVYLDFLSPQPTAQFYKQCQCLNEKKSLLYFLTQTIAYNSARIKNRFWVLVEFSVLKYPKLKKEIFGKCLYVALQYLINSITTEPVLIKLTPNMKFG